MTTIKTSDSLKIELNDTSRRILEKYKPYVFPDDKALPVITNQKMNQYLHELCKLAGIDEQVRQTYYKGNERIDVVKPKYELIGTHTGRRTFICNAIGMGIIPQVVMKWTGHSGKSNLIQAISTMRSMVRSSVRLNEHANDAEERRSKTEPRTARAKQNGAAHGAGKEC